MKRLISAAILIPLIAYVIIWSPQPVFLGVVVLLAALCFYEYCGIAAGHGVEINPWLGMVPGLAFLFVEWHHALVTTLIALVLMTAAMRKDDLTRCLPFASALLLGLAYVFGCWRSAIDLRAASPWWLLFAVTINWVGDSAAYYVGVAFGRHKMAPVVSPKKSWEGAAASAAASTLYGTLLLHFLIPTVPLWQGLVFSVVANAAGQIGDLAESAMKRGAGIKDSGNLLPGHGGWLDRVDSTLFSMPATQLLLALFY